MAGRHVGRRDSQRTQDSVLQMRLTTVLHNLLRQEARRDQRTVSNLVRMLVLEGLQRRDAFARAKKR